MHGPNLRQYIGKSNVCPKDYRKAGVKETEIGAHKTSTVPIKRRIEFKILLLTFKCVHGSAPRYLTDLVHKRKNKETRAVSKSRRPRSQHLDTEALALQRPFYGTSYVVVFYPKRTLTF